MEFRVLGPLDVLSGAERIELGGPRLRVVMASLLLEAGRVVPVTRLTEAIYGGAVPATGRVQAQICISALRRLLAGHGQWGAITTRPTGYLLRVAEGSLDMHRYDELVVAARRDQDAGRIEEAVDHYRSADALWRGPALADVDSQFLRASVRPLEERRMTAREECIDLELLLGRHRDLVAELTELVAQYPLRERLRGQLMLALYHSGRQAEALEVYRSGRRAMVDGLGLEPNEWLQKLEHKILTSGATLQPPGSAAPPAQPASEQAAGNSAEPERSRVAPVPRMLSTDIGDFTGRVEPIKEIERRLSADPGRSAVPVVVVTGKPGVGKSTLAVHFAHRLSNAYPDGQLYADLHGRGAVRADPSAVLEGFLYVLGVPCTAIPHGLHERAALYRGLLSERRMLILLDNAEDESQVLPLLPGDPGSAVLVTSLTRLPGIPGGTQVELDVLTPEQSLELLTRIVGRDRVNREPAAAATLVGLCGRLPLALRIAGARLSARPHWTIAHLVDRLKDGMGRLDELSHGGLAMRASLAVCYEAVDPAARRLFRLLAAVDFPTFSGWMAVALLNKPPHEAQELLDSLAEAQLLETTGVDGRYCFHELIGVFARERLEREESPAERYAALERVLGALSFLSNEAHRRVHGDDHHLRPARSGAHWPLPERLVERLLASPLGWYETERESTVAGMRQAARAGLIDICQDLALNALTLFESRTGLDDLREACAIGLEAARRGNHPAGQAAMLYSTGLLFMVEQRFAAARQELLTAASVFRSAGDRWGEILALRNLALADRMAGHLDAAGDGYELALVAARPLGEPAATAYALHGLAQVQLDDGRLGRARATLTEALELSRRGGDRGLESQILHRIGEIFLEEGRLGEAIACFEQVLDAARALGDPIGEAYALHGLGMASLGADPAVAHGDTPA